jgi:hypothetical protein
LLGEARRPKGDNGEPQNKCSETFVPWRATAKISKPVVFDDRQGRTLAQLGRYGTDVAIWGK